MKVANTRKVNDRIIKYMNREQLNQLIGIGVSAPVSMDEIVFEDPTDLKRYADDFQRNMKSEGFTYTDDESLIAMMVSSVARETLGSPEGQSPLPPTILNDIIKESKAFHKGCFDDNPYLKNIHFNHEKLGDFELTHASYSRYELMMYSTPANKYDGVMIPRVGTFDHKFRYPSIKENGYTWMSVTPNEIFTMEKSIKEASGNVFTLGLGMGYWAYMVSEKPDVEHVTIIEKQSNVIELFNTFILPQFEHKDKITVIQADAFEFMENLSDGEYDYCFVDIWIGNNDTVPYMKMKKICKKFKQMKMSYWIEDSLMAAIIGFVYIIILQEFYKNQNMPVPDIGDMPEDEQYKFDFLKDLLKDAEITRPEHVDYYMNYQNIINLMS